MRGRLLLILVALCAALAIAGCGSDDDSPSKETTSAASESEATTTEDSGEEGSDSEEETSDSGEEATDGGEEGEDSGEEAGEGEDSGDESSAGSKPKVTIPDGPPPEELEIVDLTEGSGSPVEAGDSVTVNYIGFGYESKKEFDASWGAEPLTFTLGEGQVIKGWDKGIVGMKPGGRREMTVPPDLGYGAKGYPGIIGKNETLIFVVDLVSAESK